VTASEVSPSAVIQSSKAASPDIYDSGQCRLVPRQISRNRAWVDPGLLKAGLIWTI
jgi:hypothetical protein